MISVGKLTVARVRNAKPGFGSSGRPVKRAYQDGDGLFLLVSPGGAKSWILGVQVDGKRRDIGLGAADVDEPPRDCRRPISLNYAAMGVSSSMA